MLGCWLCEGGADGLKEIEGLADGPVDGINDGGSVMITLCCIVPLIVSTLAPTVILLAFATTTRGSSCCTWIFKSKVWTKSITLLDPIWICVCRSRSRNRPESKLVLVASLKRGSMSGHPTHLTYASHSVVKMTSPFGDRSGETNCAEMVAFSRYRWKTSEQPSVISLYACLKSTSRNADSVGVRRRGIASRSMFILPSFVCVTLSSQREKEGEFDATREGGEDGLADMVGKGVLGVDGTLDGLLVSGEVGTALCCIVGLLVWFTLVVGGGVGDWLGDQLGIEEGSIVNGVVLGWAEGRLVP